jgi:WD40 repeat protein
MDSINAPQFLEHISHSVTYTPFDFKWIPSSPRFVVVGQTPKAKGIIQIYKMKDGKIENTHEWIHGGGYKCSTFGASSITNREIALGDFDGNVSIIDIETGKPSFQVKGHKSIINTIDGIGGSGNIGPAEIVTGSRDGNFIFY